VNYVVFREQQDGLVCVPRVHAAADCTFVTDRLNSRLSPVAQTRRTSFVDAAPDGRWVYRVAAMVSPHGPKEPGNFLALSRAATAVVPR
jgi:hypothetical protein